MKTNIFFSLILLLSFITGAGASSLIITGSIEPPTLAGNVITDHSGINYTSISNGLYKVDYNGKTTFFGFGLSGTVNSSNFKKLSTDYTWSRNVTTLGNGYKATATTTAGNWQTEFTFTDRNTKILNNVTNNLASPINNTKFYYLFTVSAGDLIQYQGETYTITGAPNIHKSGNLNYQVPQVLINNQVLFDFQDIIIHGFNITDFYIVPASSLGFNSSYNIIAIAFTKGTGEIQPGETIIIDPSLTLSGGSATLFGNQNFDYVNLTNGAVLYITSYNGTAGTGTLNLTVNNTLTVDSTSSINGAKRGYLGGSGYCSFGPYGGCGGTGPGAGGEGTSYGDSSGSGGGGAAGYGINAVGAGGTYGSPGLLYGTTIGIDIEMGSGGGSGGKYYVSRGQPVYQADPGEPGGASLKITANIINISGTITMIGGNGGRGGKNSYDDYGGDGGGASGGGILINGSYLNISSGTLTTTGGTGSGVSSGGRVKLFYKSLINTSTTISSGTLYYGLLNSAPTVPTLYSPTNGYVFNSTQTIPLEWLQSTDIDGDSITYDVAANGTTQQTGITANTTNIILPEGSHNWSVRAYDGAAYSDWATVKTLSIALIPDIITDPICTHGSNYITCTWTDPTAANFDHVYITNMTGTNNTWDSNVTAGVQNKTWSNMSHGFYSFKAQSVTTLGTKSNNYTWFNSTVNNYSFVFTDKSISSPSIYQSSGTETISVNVTDSDGNITNMTVTLTYFGVPFTYNMTQGAGDSWSYDFRTSNVGAYYVISFNGTDDYGDTSGSSWNQNFIVTPVVAGGSSSGGSGGNPSVSTTTPIPTTTTLPKVSIINLKTMQNDDTGQLILNSGLGIGAIMMLWGAVGKRTTAGTLIWGLIIMVVSAYGLGLIL